MKIAMIGTGYVGLVSGVCFSDFGHEVVCVDKDPKKITMLEAGEVPIYEPGLDEVLLRNVAAGRQGTPFDVELPLDFERAIRDGVELRMTMHGAIISNGVPPPTSR